MGLTSWVNASFSHRSAAGVALLAVGCGTVWCDAAAPAKTCDRSGGGVCAAQENILLQRPGLHRVRLAKDVRSPGHDFVQTPFSTLAHRDCVVEVPSETQRVAHPTLDNHNILKFSNGTNRTLEPCRFAMPRPYTYHAPPDASTGNQSALSSGSCNIGGGEASSGPLASHGSTLSSSLEKFTANVYVPEDPAAAVDDTTWLYWWIGSLPKDYSHVLQPVLGYNKHVGWEITSWDCCPGGNMLRSEAIKGLQTHDKIPMSIVADPWVRDQYKVEACSASRGSCTTLTATNTGSQVVPLIQFETYNVASRCGGSWCSDVRCHFLPNSALVVDGIEVSPPTTWQPASSRCFSLVQDCGWRVDMYSKEKGYKPEALWAQPPR